MITKTSDGIVRHHLLDPGRVDLYRTHAIALRGGAPRAPSAARPLALTALTIIGGLALAFTILSEPANGRGGDIDVDTAMETEARVVIVRLADTEVGACSAAAQDAFAWQRRRSADAPDDDVWSAFEPIGPTACVLPQGAY